MEHEEEDVQKVVHQHYTCYSFLRLPYDVIVFFKCIIALHLA